MTLAPWLQPPDFLGAIQSGAQLGLGIRRNDLEQAQMAQRAQEAARQLQQSWAAKVMANQADLERNRIAAQAADEARLQRNVALEDTQNFRMEQLKQKDRELGMPKLGDVGGHVVDMRTGNVVWSPPPKPTTPKANPFDLAEYNGLNSQRSKLPTMIAGGTLTPEQANVVSNQLTGQMESIRSRFGLQPNQTNAAPFPLQTNSVTPTNSVPLPASTNSITNSPADGTIQNQSTNRVAVGGYQIGKRYRGLTYLGGDPNDETNWK